MGGAVSSVVEVVSDAVSDVGDVVSDAGSWIDDNVIQPIKDDPINSAIKIGAYYFGGPIAGSLATAGITAAQGGDLEDIAKSAATSYVAGQAGAQVGGAVGGTVAGETGSTIAGNIAGGAAGGAAAGATGSALSGGNVGQGFLTGLLTGGVNSGVNTAGNAISNAYYTGSNQMGDNFQIFDDGTSLQTFDDGSAIYSDTGGQTYVLDTSSGYAQAINSATGQPIGVASNSLFDSVVNAGKTFASTALKAALGSAGGVGTATKPGLITGAANTALTAQQIAQLQNVYQSNVGMQQGITNRAVDLAQFKPVGVTTAFGQSQYTTDPVTGRITQAGYTSTPQIQAAQQGLMSAGQAVIPTGNLQQQAANIMSQQQGLLAPGRQQQLAQLQNKVFQTGRTGLATGGTTVGYTPGSSGLMAANPDMAAYYNALAQQDATLAANAQNQALAQAQGQTALSGSLFGQAGALESMAQQPLTLGAALAAQQATAGAQAGRFGLLGGQSAAATQLQGNIGQVIQQGQMYGNVINPLASAAQQGLSSVVSEWLK